MDVKRGSHRDCGWISVQRYKNTRVEHFVVQPTRMARFFLDFEFQVVYLTIDTAIELLRKSCG